MGLQPVRIFIGVDDADGTFIPLNVDASGNVGVNLEGELAVGELQLAAADPGLVQLATALAGATTPKTILDLYNLLNGTNLLGFVGDEYEKETTITTTNLAHGATYAQAVQDRFGYAYSPANVRGRVYMDKAGTLVIKESENADKSSATTLATVSVTASTTTSIVPVQLSKRYFWFELTNNDGSHTTTSLALTQATGVAQETTTNYFFNAYATDTPSTGVDMSIMGMKMAAIQVVTPAGTTSFTLDFEISIDGVNFVPSCAVTSFADGSDSTSLTGAASFNGAYNIMVAGAKYLRCNLSAFTHGTGSLTVFARAVA